jgi:hypothetical protein
LVKKLVREAKVEPRHLDQRADPQHGHASGKALGPLNLRSDPGWTWDFFQSQMSENWPKVARYLTRRRGDFG